jgi:pilus assembly protein CpaB
MTRNRLVFVLAMAVLVGFFASMYVYRKLQSQAAGKTPVALRKVVVAADRIALGTRLGPEVLRVINWPADQPMAGMFGSVTEVQGRTLITSVTENEPILETKLAPTGAGAGLPATIPDGMRALTVAVNDVIGVAGFVVPGTMVDVLVTGNGPSQNQNGSVTKTVLENVRVLAAGQKVEQDKDGKPQNVPVITLLVTPADANKLTMAATQGRIQLALRNTIDTEKVNPPPVLQAALFSGGEAPPPPKRGAIRRTVPTPAPFVVEILVGSKRENKSFPNP